MEVVWHATVRVALYMGRGAVVSQLREFAPYLRAAVMMHWAPRGQPATTAASGS